MAKEPNQSHHLSQAGGNVETGPLRQHHRLATGDKVSGKDNPNGATVASTENKVANSKGKNY